MEEPQRKSFQSLKSRAILYMVCCIIVILLLTVLTGGSTVGGHLGILAGGLLAYKCYKTEETEWHFRSCFHDFDWEAAAGFVLLEWSIGNLAMHLVGTVGAMISQGGGHLEGTHPSGTLLELIGTVLIAPFGEELIFRQCGAGLLKKCAGKPMTYLLPAALFAFAHLNFHVQALTQYLAAAMVYTVCYLYTGNVLNGMAVHAVHNLMCDLMLTEKHGARGYMMLKPISVVTNLVMLAAGTAWFILRFYPRYIKPKKEEMYAEL